MEIRDYKILMVDDEAEYLDAKVLYFMSKGYNIKSMGNPVEALELLKTSSVDVLIVDYFMPEMTGEELVKNLREINKDIVVILQTGYAGQKPPKEMFEGLTIQGYFNKTEGTDELELIVLSALRAAELMRIVKRNAEEKLLRNKKDEYFANKISWITGEIKERLAAMNGPVIFAEDWLDKTQISSDDKEMLEQKLMYIKENMSKINSSMNALNISSQRQMTPKNMLNMIQELLKIEMWFKKIKLNLEISEAVGFIDMNGGIVPYIICQDIENRANAGSEEINVNETLDGNNFVIKIQSDLGINTEQKAELEKIASICDTLKLRITGNLTEIVINKNV